MKMFQNYIQKGLSLKNRIVMPPMCMYSADQSGIANEFHLIHYVTRAVGGVGLIIVEATGVTPNGRISENDLGLWNDVQMESLKSIVNQVHQYGTKIGIQLGHAGRKYIGESYDPVAPSGIAFNKESRIPVELNKENIRSIIDSFIQSAIFADKAGFDVIEVHGAHGYLIHQFLSPISNKRTDEYGGDIEGRVRFLKEIVKGIRQEIPKEKPIFLRVSATDYHEEGISTSDMVEIIHKVKEFVDVVHVSSGGLIEVSMDIYPGYQVSLSQKIKNECDIDTIAVGKITTADMIEEILGNNRADLVALGRELLKNPYFVIHSIADKDMKNQLIPRQYLRGF